jgi:phosphoglycolate phosphatase-like HAD superfamily hydrolase
MAAHGIDPGDAWMVGDSDTDVAAGASAGARTALVEHPKTAHRRKPGAVPPPDAIVSSLQDFVELIRNPAEVA